MRNWRLFDEKVCRAQIYEIDKYTFHLCALVFEFFLQKQFSKIDIMEDMSLTQHNVFGCLVVEEINSDQG